MAAFDLFISTIAGMLLGVFYFGGLWITTQRLPQARRPYRLLLASFLIRAAVVVTGFYLFMAGRWEKLLACLLGFLIARTLMLLCCLPTLRRSTS